MAHEARREVNASTDIQYGFTCVFITEPGGYGEFPKSVGKWKKTCHQCGRLKVLKDFVSVAQLAEDTALNSERAEEMKDKLMMAVWDHKAVSQENDEMKASLRDLREDNDRLGRQGVESQQELWAEKQKKTEAHICTILWTRARQKQEAEPRASADTQWKKVESAEAAASELRQEHEVLNATVRDIEVELQQ